MILTPEEQKVLLKNNLKIFPVNADLSDLDRLEEYRHWMATFTNRNEHLAAYIYEQAWLDDSRGVTKVYLVLDTSLINEDGKPITPDTDPVVLYFGLKSGQLYTEEDHNLTKYEETFVEYYKNAYIQKNQKQIDDLLLFAESYIKPHDRIDTLSSLAKLRAHRMLDKKLVGEDDHALYVSKCYPAVELTHFVKNENYKPAEEITLAIGKYIFWNMITPTILDLSSKIGLQYVYLFAADDNAENPHYVEMMQNFEDIMDMKFNRLGLTNPREKQSQDLNKLIKYYDKHLKFRLIDDKNVLKPTYDYVCYCMVQSIQNLRFNYQDYLTGYLEDSSEI